MAIILDIILALSKGIPELDGPVAGPGDDLPIIGTEADGKDVRSMADETTRGLAVVQVPETESMIPRSREGKLAIGGDDDVRYEVVVSVQDTFWIAVRVLVTGQLPDDYGLVCTRYELLNEREWDQEEDKYRGRQSGSCLGSLRRSQWRSPSPCGRATSQENAVIPPSFVNSRWTSRDCTHPSRVT